MLEWTYDGTNASLNLPGYGIIQAAGVTVPADGKPGFAPGCLFQHIDGTGGNVLYCNIATGNTACDFNLVTIAA